MGSHFLPRGSFWCRDWTQVSVLQGDSLPSGSKKKTVKKERAHPALQRLIGVFYMHIWNPFITNPCYTSEDRGSLFPSNFPMQLLHVTQPESVTSFNSTKNLFHTQDPGQRVYKSSPWNMFSISFIHFSRSPSLHPLITESLSLQESTKASEIWLHCNEPQSDWW